MPTWFITCCSTGLGHSLAKAVLEAGHNAIVTARDADHVRNFEQSYPGRALAVSLDLTDPSSISRAVAEAAERFGDIDVLVNNAGYGYRAAVEEADEQDVADLFAKHVFGPVALTKALLPAMRARRQGTIVNFSSIGAQFYNPGSGYYSAAKMALEGVTLTRKLEVEPLGIRVMVIEPAAFRTDFSGRSLKGLYNRDRGLCCDCRTAPQEERSRPRHSARRSRSCGRRDPRDNREGKAARPAAVRERCGHDRAQGPERSARRDRRG